LLGRASETRDAGQPLVPGRPVHRHLDEVAAVRRSTTTRLTAVLLTVGLLAACGADETADPADAEAPAGTPVVSGAFGEPPSIELPTGVAGDELVVEILEEGDGATVEDGQVIVANYQGVIWSGAGAAEGDTSTSTSGTAGSGSTSAAPVFDTFASGLPEAFTLTAEQVLKGMQDGLVDTTVGSRVMIVVPPAEGFGEQGQQEIGVGPTDTLVFVFDVLDSFQGDQAAEGVEVAADPALPTVEESDSGPTATMPATPAPTELISHVLVQGDGAPVETGQLLVAQYRGQLYKDGSEFDSSWSRGAPTGFPIGVGRVISGWDKTLVGQAIGSRVLLVIPPAEGYGEGGNPPTIAGDDTLVFVVDILGAYGDGAPAPGEPSATPTG